MELRDLPSVDELARGVDDPLAVAAARTVLEQAREEIRAGADPGDLGARLVAELSAARAPSLRRVLNATGVIVHTNLGRAPLADEALAQVVEAARGYSNLELDLSAGARGSRQDHVAAILRRLTGAEAALVVNNNAAAMLLALAALAEGREVIVSRGELIEIGDGFRIPDIMAASGAVLREVGTTNRTRIEDYRDAIGERTRVILRVHPSNFHIEGFTAKPSLDQLAALARERGLPLYEDLGSGCVADLSAFGIREPLVSESLAAGVNLVSFSGDKLLGGPQAGLIAGDTELVSRVRRNTLFRALRLDKLITQALETTLRHLIFERWDHIPALRMVRTSLDEIRERAERLRAAIPSLELLEGRSVAGGGSTPDQTMPTWLLAVPGHAVTAERQLRARTPPIIGRIENDRLVLDLRTVFAEEEDELVRALQALSR